MLRSAWAWRIGKPRRVPPARLHTVYARAAGPRACRRGGKGGKACQVRFPPGPRSLFPIPSSLFPIPSSRLPLSNFRVARDPRLNVGDDTQITCTVYRFYDLRCLIHRKAHRRYEQPAPQAPDGALSGRAERHPARAQPGPSLREPVGVDGSPGKLFLTRATGSGIWPAISESKPLGPSWTQPEIEPKTNRFTAR